MHISKTNQNYYSIFNVKLYIHIIQIETYPDLNIIINNFGILKTTKSTFKI